MNLPANTKQTKIAEKIIRSYNRAIAQTNAGQTDAACYARPLSALEYNKAQIKQALFVALASLGADDADLGETLTRSFLLLAQFIPDAQADIARRGQSAIVSGDPRHADIELGEQALKIINDIKAETEELRAEANAYIARKAEERRAAGG